MKIITFVFKSLWWIISGVFGIIFNMLSKKPKYKFVKIQTGEKLDVYSKEELFEIVTKHIPKYDKIEMSDNEKILVTTFKEQGKNSIWECPNLDTMIDVIKSNDWGTYEYYIEKV